MVLNRGETVIVLCHEHSCVDTDKNSSFNVPAFSLFVVHIFFEF